MVIHLLKRTAVEWVEDKAPQLGAALAYYTVFSLAPLILVLLAIVGVLFRNDPAGAWSKVTEQMGYFLDPSAMQVIQDIAQKASEPAKSVVATIIGFVLAIFGASGVFGQLQDALNTIWGLKAKPGAGILGFSARALSLFRDGGRNLFSSACFACNRRRAQRSEPISPRLGARRSDAALCIYLIFDLVVVLLLFAMIFKYLPDAKIHWRDVWVGAALTAFLFLAGKWALGLYLGSGAAGSAYGAASSLITLLLWIYYSSQILLFGAEFTQVYADEFGSPVEPNEYAVRIEQKEIEHPRTAKSV